MTGVCVRGAGGGRRGEEFRERHGARERVRERERERACYIQSLIVLHDQILLRAFIGILAVGRV
jgi:hypothetical protein